MQMIVFYQLCSSFFVMQFASIPREGAVGQTVVYIRVLHR